MVWVAGLNAQSTWITTPRRRMARGTLRFSTGRNTTLEEVSEAIFAVAGAILKLRRPE